MASSDNDIVVRISGALDGSFQQASQGASAALDALQQSASSTNETLQQGTPVIVRATDAIANTGEVVKNAAVVIDRDFNAAINQSMQAFKAQERAIQAQVAGFAGLDEKLQENISILQAHKRLLESDAGAKAARQEAILAAQVKLLTKDLQDEARAFVSAKDSATPFEVEVENLNIRLGESITKLRQNEARQKYIRKLQERASVSDIDEMTDALLAVAVERYLDGKTR